MSLGLGFLCQRTECTSKVTRRECGALSLAHGGHIMLVPGVRQSKWRRRRVYFRVARPSGGCSHRPCEPGCIPADSGPFLLCQLAREKGYT